jgi:hypothetical protein
MKAALPLPGGRRVIGRRALATLLVLAAACGLFLLARGARVGKARTERVSTEAVVAPLAPPPLPTPAIPPVPAPAAAEGAPPPVQASRAPEDPVPGDDGPGDEFAFYDGLSGRLSPQARPEPSGRTEVQSVGEAPRLTVWSDRLQVNVGESTTLHAVLKSGDGDDVHPDQIFVRVGRADALGTGTEIGMVPQGSASGVEYLATFAADEAFHPRADPGGRLEAPVGVNYTVTAQGIWSDKPFTRLAANLLFVHRAGALVQRTGGRLQKTDRGLVMTASANVERPGDYWAYAELWGGPDGTKPIAFGQRRYPDRRAGKLELEILFGARIIANAGVDGPFTIRNLRIDNVDTVPPHRVPPIAVWAVSPPYRAVHFR